MTSYGSCVHDICGGCSLGAGPQHRRHHLWHGQGLGHAHRATWLLGLRNTCLTCLVWVTKGGCGCGGLIRDAALSGAATAAFRG